MSMLQTTSDITLLRCLRPTMSWNFEAAFWWLQNFSSRSEVESLCCQQNETFIPTSLKQEPKPRWVSEAILVWLSSCYAAAGLHRMSVYLHRNVKYDALWHMNLINGFLIVWPNDECGAMMYENENRGNIMPAQMGWKIAKIVNSISDIFVHLFYSPILQISSDCSAMFFLRKPGSPSYQMEASSCCTFGWLTNCNSENCKS